MVISLLPAFFPLSKLQAFPLPLPLPLLCHSFLESYPAGTPRQAPQLHVAIAKGLVTPLERSGFWHDINLPPLPNPQNATKGKVINGHEAHILVSLCSTEFAA